jgi:long-chain fatty acid transport protein
MKKLFVWICAGIIPVTVLSQVGHIMPGIGAVNMSMGGASTAQPIEVSGALQWNPAAITAFNKNTFSVNAGLFFSSPELTSTVPTSSGSITGTTLDDRGVSIMPAIAMLWAKKESKHRWGLSAFGISGFGVTFPQSQTNPINMPQSMGGFGQIKSDYQLMQIGGSYAYKISAGFSIGICPTFNLATLSLEPNPIASPSNTKGYPISNKATAMGIGAQVGIYYEHPSGIKLGSSYKTQQYFSDFDFQNTYLDGSAAPNATFKMNYPAILSLGFGYSNKAIDFALDYRKVNYENTTGFDKKGWTPTASVAGFGWKNIDVISAGLQYKGIKKLPVRLGYTYGSNPIDPQFAFFSTPATAIIKNAFQIGFGYEINSKCTLNAVFHSGNSNGSTSGPLLSPMMISAANPYGSIPGSAVSYKMSTALLMFGLNYQF